MSFNPTDPATLKALQELRANTSARNISAWIAGTKRIPRIHFVKIMRVIEGAEL